MINLEIFGRPVNLVTIIVMIVLVWYAAYAVHTHANSSSDNA